MIKCDHDEEGICENTVVHYVILKSRFDDTYRAYCEYHFTFATSGLIVKKITKEEYEIHQVLTK